MSKIIKDMYENLFIKFSNKIESVLIKALLILGVLIIIAQISLQFKVIRQSIVPVEKQEGEHLERISRP
jgi:hypothetical protein